MANNGRSIEVQLRDMPPISKDSQLIKFGITTTLRVQDASNGGELVELYPNQPISEALQQVCHKWGFVDVSDYALRYAEANGHYLTEAMRKEVSGKVVSMCYSPEKVSLQLLERLSDENQMTLALADLGLRASDPTFTEAFIKKDGLNFLLDMIVKDKFVEKEKGLQLACKALLDLIPSSTTITWELLEGPVLSKIINYVNSPNPKGASHLRIALPPTLQVLEAMISAGVSEQIEKEVALQSLITHMGSSDRDIQQNVLSLVNTLLAKADPNRRRQLASTLNSRQYRAIVLKSIIDRAGERPAETDHQLYVLQTLLLNLLEERKMTPVDTQDQHSLNRIKDLCRIAFDSEAGFLSYSADSNNGLRKDKPNYTRDYKKLGFRNEVNPAQDFAVVPPGILALDCMHHLAHNHTEAYNKLVIECAYRSAGDEFLLPFARASIALTNVLCDLLQVGEPAGDQQGKFYTFFFQHEKPFEELFCICAQLVAKTWKEMRATVEDFDKVFDVVKEQIRRALDITPETFVKFHDKLNTLTYSEITSLRAQERSSREEYELQAKPIQELKQKLVPEIQALIKQNRINCLISGTRFNKFASKGQGLVSAGATTLKRVKEKFWYCRLSPNEKTLHYGDCEEKSSPMPENLSNKLTVLEIKELLTGKDCPHMKESKKNRNSPFAFSLVKEREPLSSLDFVAPDSKTFDVWTDGINALLGKPMVSKAAVDDMDTLLHLELKLRLLDIEGISIPQEPPPIPPPPPNYDYGSFSSSAAK